jgi:LEA14-like dessication related protein
MFRARKFLVFSLGLLSTALMLPAAPPKSEIEITVREKKIENMSTEGLSFVFYLNVSNPLDSAQWLAKYDYRLVIEQTEYLKLDTTLDAPIKIDSKRSVAVSLPIKITYDLLLRAVPNVPGKDKLACFLAGGMTFQDERRREKRIQIAFAGEFPIFRGMTVEFRPIETKALTVGGADLAFKFVLKNPNGFDFKVERLSYKLDFVEKTVSAGVIGQSLSIAQRSEQLFSIPLLLDFFEMGKDIYDGLAQPPLPVAFTGEAEVESVWGNFKIPFSKTDKVDVLKIS